MKAFALGCIFLCLFKFSLGALELKPWFDPMVELQNRTSVIAQLYNAIDTKEGLEKHPAGNFFLDYELYTTLLQNWSVEIEAIGAATRQRSFGFDSVSLTGRYLWLDDVVGDPASLTTGLTIYKVFKPSRRDLSIIHHGGIEAELHTAVGKEISCREQWNTRTWAVGGIGMGDLGSAWIRADGHWEHKWCARHFLRLSLLSLWGLGHRSLNHLSHFHGYGPIQHRSIDAALRYGFLGRYGIVLNAEYSFRLYAKNCPAYVHYFLLILDYPISL